MPRLPVLTVLALSAWGAGVSLQKGPAEGRLLGMHRYSSSLEGYSTTARLASRQDHIPHL